MTEPSTGTEFLALLQRSQLLNTRVLTKLEKSVGEIGSSGKDARKLAATLVKSGIITVWQARRLLAGKRNGFYIGRYKLLEVLGAGGMGHVYLAEQITMQRLVALKLIRADTNKKHWKEVIARFTREARAVAALSHPNIVQAFDFDEVDGTPYMVMEFMEGIDAAQQHNKFGRIPWPQVADYVVQAAAGIDHAHKAGLVHRDIKPSNLHIDREGHVKILDLGLVSVTEGSQNDSLTVEQNQLGSVDYIAPEQALDSHLVDARADIYGLGASFYVLITGQLLFEATTTAQKLLAQQTKTPQPVGELVDDLPVELGEIITRMIAKDPADRIQTAAEVVEAVRPFAKRQVPPYDVSAIRHTHDAIKPFLRRSPDASELQRDQTGAVSELAQADRNPETGSTATLSDQDSFLNDASSGIFDFSTNSEFETMRPRGLSGSRKKKAAEKKAAEKQAATSKKTTAKKTSPATASSGNAKGKKKRRQSSLPFILASAVVGLLISGGLYYAVRGSGTEPSPDSTSKKKTAEVDLNADKAAEDAAKVEPEPIEPQKVARVLLTENFEGGQAAKVPFQTHPQEGGMAQIVLKDDDHVLQMLGPNLRSSVRTEWDLGPDQQLQPFRLQLDWCARKARVDGEIISLAGSDKNEYVLQIRMIKDGNKLQITDGDQRRAIDVIYEQGEWYRFIVEHDSPEEGPPRYHLLIKSRGRTNTVDVRIVFDTRDSKEEPPRLQRHNMRWLRSRLLSDQAAGGYSYDLDNLALTIYE